MSVVSAPIQQGPAPANTQTRIHNNTLKVASVGGGQNAVYHVVGGPIANNVNLSLPAVSSDDTIATLGANNSWTGQHSFGNGLTASGPITSTASISTSSSITGSSIFSQGGLTANGPIIANGDLTVVGNFNPANLSTPGTLSVGTTATITGTINASGTTNLGTTVVTGSHTVSGLHFVANTGGLTNQGNLTAFNPNNKAYVAGTGHLLLRNDTGGSNHDFYGIQTGINQFGVLVGTTSSDRLGFWGGSATNATNKTAGQQASVFGSGAPFQAADGTWTAKNQNMLTQAYNILQFTGFIN